jgi:hypothetical protein
LSTLGKVDEFERYAPIANAVKPPRGRRYDATFKDAANRLIDVDVKNWTNFNPGRKEAKKFQSDIIIQFRKGDGFQTFHWAFPTTMGNQQGIQAWMLKQLDAPHVKKHLTPLQLQQARAQLSGRIQHIAEFF